MAGGVTAVGGAGNGGANNFKIQEIATKLATNAKLTSEDIQVIRENKAEVLKAYNSNPKADYKSEQNFDSFINNKHAELIIDKINTNQPRDKYDIQLMVAKPAYFNDIEPTVLRSVLKEFLQNNQMSDALGSICIDCGGGPCDECGSTGKLLDMIDDAKDSSLKNKVMEKLLDSILDGTPKLGKEITKSIRSAVIDSVTKDELVSLINKNADDPKLKDAIKNEILQELSNPSRAHLTINDLKDIAKALNDPGFTLIVEDLESKGFKSLKDVPKDYKIPDSMTTEINNLSEKIKPENVQKKVGSSYLNLLEKDGSFNDLHKNLIDELKVIVSKKELSESDIKQLNKIRSAITTKLKQEGKTDLEAKLKESTTKEVK